MSRALTWLRVRAELARASNLPTVWTNVLVGTAVGGHAAKHATTAGSGGEEPVAIWAVGVWAAMAVSMMYLGGMVLNDVLDASVDREQRPGRPIPAGRISSRDAMIFAFVLLGGGAVLLGVTGAASAIVSAVLLAAIVVYNVMHSRTSASVLLLGVCRACAHLAPIAMLAGFDAPAWAYAPAVAAFVYTAMLSIIARDETQRDASPVHGLAWALPVPALLLALPLRPENWIAPALVAIAMTFWLARAASALQPPKSSPKQAVLGMLAGFCLVDAWTLLLVGAWASALLAGACFVLTVLGHRRIMGT